LDPNLQKKGEAQGLWNDLLVKQNNPKQQLEYKFISDDVLFVSLEMGNLINNPYLF
jgi:hypothetical protein